MKIVDPRDQLTLAESLYPRQSWSAWRSRSQGLMTQYPSVPELDVRVARRIGSCCSKLGPWVLLGPPTPLQWILPWYQMKALQTIVMNQ